MTAGAPIKLTRLALLAGAILLGAAGSAAAFDTPPFKGNDTGGIIAYEYARQIDIRALQFAKAAIGRRRLADSIRQLLQRRHVSNSKSPDVELRF